MSKLVDVLLGCDINEKKEILDANDDSYWKTIKYINIHSKSYTKIFNNTKFHIQFYLLGITSYINIINN